MYSPDYLARFTDEALQAKAALPRPNGFARAAEYLLDRLDTPERRARADAEGHTLSNIRGGRYADMVWDACNDLRRLIEQGREDDELYGERFARRERERDQAARQANLHAAAAAARRDLS